MPEDDVLFGDAGSSLHDELCGDKNGSMLFSFDMNGLKGIIRGHFDLRVGRSLSITTLVFLLQMLEPGFSYFPIFL